MDPQDLDEEELAIRFVDINIDEVELISRLPLYMSSRKPTAKVTKDLDSIKYKIFTPLLLEEVPIEGKLLAKAPNLCMEDWDLNDRNKYPQFEPIKCLQYVYYEEVGVTRVEPMKWVVRIQHIGLLNMLYVPHFGRSNINTICVRQLLELVHDRHFWLGDPILIDDMLIRRIIALLHQGANSNEAFVGKYQEKKLVDQMKNDYGIIKKS